MRLAKYFILFLFLTNVSYAANVTNNLQGVGPDDAMINPYFCIQNAGGAVTYSLKHGETVDGNKYSDNLWYVGGALRFGGCDADKNTYLGYVGASVATQPHSNSMTYTAPKAGVHLTLSNYAITSDDTGTITGKIDYTAINPNFNLLAPNQNTNWSFVGINLSGLEFDKVINPIVVPNLSSEDSNTDYTDLGDTQKFIKAGMNTVRVPISWGYLQLKGAGQGDLNLSYYNSFVKPLLESLTSAKVYAVVDMHAYMRYSVFGKEYSGCGATGPCPDGTLVTDANAYQDIWSKLYTLMSQDSKINMDYILLDLMNEPVDVPNDSVFTIQTSVIKKLRNQGFQGYILVEGNAWSGLHSWTTANWTSTDGKTTYTNASLFTKENFNNAGITDLSKIIINVHQYFDNNYSGTGTQCLTDLTTTGANGFNLDAFVDYLQRNNLKAMVTEFGSGTDSTTCSTALTQFMDYLKNNTANNKDYGFLGWTIWSTGHGWGNYNLRVTPTSYHMTVLNKYLQASNE